MELNNVLINGYDLIIITIIIIANILYYAKLRKLKTSKPIGCLIEILLLILFSIAFPLISIHFEIKLSVAKVPMTESFNLLYTFFRFPLYWSIGIIQLLVYKFFTSRFKNKRYI